MSAKLNPFKPNPKSFKNTFCVFEEIALSAIDNLQPNHASDSGSQYFYTEKGMYRLSNHWGRLANSKWRLIAMEPETNTKTKLGFALWTDFHPDNNVDLLYYLEVDFEKQTVTYQHKNNPNYDGKPILRTSLDTTKRIKQARNILTLTNWAKYFDTDDITALRLTIINELNYTNQSLEDIKRKL